MSINRGESAKVYTFSLFSYILCYNDSMTVAQFKKRFYFVAAKYFRHFANMVFRRWHPRVIAVTGSAGKTTMLNLLEHEIGKKPIIPMTRIRRSGFLLTF